MDKMIYHGSSEIVRAPAFGAGRPYNDFGLGFYCAESPAQAAVWAVKRESNGFVSAFRLNTDGLRIIDLCSSRYTPLSWLSMLFSFREFDKSDPLVYRAGEYINKYFSVDHQGCDCIIGYRGDNSCFLSARQFLEGRISYQAICRFLSDRAWNRQFVLKSNRAFDRVSFSGYSTAASADHFASAYSAELKSIRRLRASAQKNELFIDRMIQEEIKPYDPRIR